MQIFTKKPPVTYITHTQYAIVNEAGYPMNQWGIFTVPATSILLFHREDLCEKELAFQKKKYQRSDVSRARVVKCTVSWQKLPDLDE